MAPVYNAVLKGHDPCWYCSGNRISDADAHALLAAADLQPLEEYRQAGLAWRCRCTRCDSIALTVLTRLKFTGVRGCPLCQRGGFRPHEPACLYLLHLSGHDVYKIGVTNQYEFRIREHRRFGLVPLALDGGRSIWPVPDGEQALAVEDAVLRLWRVGLRLPQALTPRTCPRTARRRPPVWVRPSSAGPSTRSSGSCAPDPTPRPRTATRSCPCCSGTPRSPAPPSRGAPLSSPVPGAPRAARNA